MSKIGWGITGAGDLLLETFELMEKISKKYKISCFLSQAGERVVRIYGLWERLKDVCPGGYYREIILDLEEGAASPIAGRFQRGTYKALVISPATSNTVAKAAVGISDTLVTNALSHARKGNVPIIIVPTDWGDKKISRMPYVIDRGICREKLGTSLESCRIIDFCPSGAIIEADGLPKINLSECEGCGNCVEACPYSAVTFGKEVEVKVSEIEMDNVQKLREDESFTVLKSPGKISGVLEEL